MPRRLTRLSALAAGVLAGLVLVAAPAAAAPSCAADPYEIDDPSTGVGPPAAPAPIAVGGTVRRAICQGRETMPGKSDPRDVDWFVFTAVEGQAYTVEITDVGSGLVNDADSGGLGVGIQQIGPDGQPSGVPQSTARSGDRSTTLALKAGRYLIGAATTDQQVYPDNVLATKTVEGAAGVYGIRLTATAPAPVLKSITISPTAVKGGKQSTATLTFTAPLLSGTTAVPVASSDGFVANPGYSSAWVPAGTTTVKVPINTRAVSRDTTVTLSAWVSGVGPTLSTGLTVRR